MWTTTIIYDIIIIIAVPIINRKRKRKLPFKLCMPFVGLTPLRLLRPNMTVLYYVNGRLQRTFSRFWQDYFAGFYFRDVNMQI